MTASQEDSPEPPPTSEEGAEADNGSGPVGIDSQKLLRIAGVTRELLEEARRIRPEAGAVDHLRQVHAQITVELKEALPPELFRELDELTPEVRDGTLEELALAHSEILGWLEGLFQGTQLALQAQAARTFHERMQGGGMRPELPGARRPDPGDSQYL